MLCLMSRIENTVQNSTQEIIDVMSLNEFPRIPFIMKGYLGGELRNFEALESDVFFYYDLIELWYIDRKQEGWMTTDIRFATRILSNLKTNKIKNYPLISPEGGLRLSTKYYEE